jgi:hypothetical protein
MVWVYRLCLGCVIGSALVPSDAAFGALAKQAGGSGLSGTLSSNRAIRQQQLVCDPDEPFRGSTSVRYDPTIVTLVGWRYGPGYFPRSPGAQTGLVEVRTGQATALQNIDQFLSQPAGTETGYVQIAYEDDGAQGQIDPDQDFVTVDEDGPAAADTHALFFDYLINVPDTRIAAYDIYADPGGRPSGNQADFLELFNPAAPIIIPASQITSAHVEGNLLPEPGSAAVIGLLAAVAQCRRPGRRRADAA